MYQPNLPILFKFDSENPFQSAADTLFHLNESSKDKNNPETFRYKMLHEQCLQNMYSLVFCDLMNSETEKAKAKVAAKKLLKKYLDEAQKLKNHYLKEFPKTSIGAELWAYFQQTFDRFSHHYPPFQKQKNSNHTFNYFPLEQNGYFCIFVATLLLADYEAMLDVKDDTKIAAFFLLQAHSIIQLLLGQSDSFYSTNERNKIFKPLTKGL